MSVVGFEVRSRAPYADGQAFGDVGPYERIDASITFAVDPAHTANASVADLALAPRDADGRVRFRSDAVLLVPMHPSRANGAVIVDVVNRGGPLTPRLNRATGDDMRTMPPGDGFLFRHGYAVAAIGWQWDVLPANGLGLDAPLAERDGQRVTGQVMVEFRPDTRQPTRLLANRVHRPYPALDPNEPDARMFVRDYEDDSPVELPRSRWRFSRVTDAAESVSAEHVTLDGGFQAGRIYHVVYTTDRAPIVGVGMLALREAALFLRAPSALNPCMDGFSSTLAFGVSQTGRLLRTLLRFGLNIGEDGRRAFDGMLIHVAGGRLGEFNHRFAQPSVQPQPGFGHLGPFTDEPTDDPLTGARGGLLDRVRALGVAPRIVATPSSAEYWRGDGSLAHIDALGRRDLPEAPETRIYHFAGTQHMAGALPQRRDSGTEGTRGQFRYNVVDYTPLQRAALAHLHRWVNDGVEPPRSRHPRVLDGTAITREQALRRIAALGIPVPAVDRLWRIRTLDLGTATDARVGRYPPEEGAEYTALVSEVDIDGNEVAGVRLPDLTVPVATHLPWNLRDPSIGAPEQILSMLGASLPFAASSASRAQGDPRIPIVERYHSRETYRARVHEETQRLIADGYVLPEDEMIVVEACLARYDAFVTGAESLFGA